MNFVRKNRTSVWFVVVASLWGQTGCAQILGWDESKAGAATSCEAATLECPNQEHDCCDSPMVGSGTVDNCDGPSSPFRLDAYEVTVGRFKAFVEAKAEGAPSEKQLEDELTSCLNKVGGVIGKREDKGEPTFGKGDNLPMNCVTWRWADAFCRWDRGSLPTMAQYMTAAREDGPTYPWGEAKPTKDRATFGGASLAPVGQTRSGQAPSGQFDLVGNVREWSSTNDACPPQFIDPTQMVNGYIFGGSFASGDGELKKGTRTLIQGVSILHEQTGFRCARDL